MGDLSHVTERLEAHGIRATRQRLDVARVLLAEPRHLTAEQVISELGRAGCRVARATVYNTLSLFSRQGLIRELALDPARVVYDSTPTRHHHFHVADTGELIDIDARAISLEDLPPLPDGCEVEGVEVIVRLRRKAGTERA